MFRRALLQVLAIIPGSLEEIASAFRNARRAASSGGVGSLSNDFVGGNPSEQLRNINAQNGVFNCIGCAFAVDATVKGRPASALGDAFAQTRIGALDLESSFGKTNNI